jgi:hypothetical protein
MRLDRPPVRQFLHVSAAALRLEIGRGGREEPGAGLGTIASAWRSAAAAAFTFWFEMSILRLSRSSTGSS